MSITDARRSLLSNNEDLPKQRGYADLRKCHGVVRFFDQEIAYISKHFAHTWISSRSPVK